MKRTILTASLLFTLAAVALAQTAHWITADDSLCNEQNTWIEFRKDFTLNKRTSKVEARIAADSKYWLWVNGQPVVFEGGLKRGPNPTDTYFDVIDLTPYLKRGGNSLRLLLWHFGKAGFSHINSGKAGVIVNVPAIGLVSDSSWFSQRLKAYQSTGKPTPNFRLPESSIRYDARLDGQNEFRPSVEIGEWGSAPWNRLVERPIPQWRDSGVQMAEAEQKNDGHGQIIRTVRLPYNMQLTPFIDVTDANGGTTLRIETDHVNGGSQSCVRAEYITRQGRQQYESLGWMNGEELYIIYPETANVTVNGVGYRETGYATDFEGYFECGDSLINRFWQKAMRTLYVNMRDNYFDCPDRERAQWWGDITILMGQSFYQLSPTANALMRKAIRELADWQKPDGTLFSPIPAENWDSELPAQSLAAISTYGFWYYYLHTGDRETMEYVYPAMRRYLALWRLDADGLTEERRGGWPWGDWGTDVDMRLMLAAWHYLALQSAVNTARLTDNETDVPGYERQIESIRSAFNRCWNGYAYRHPSYHGSTDDRVQAMAILAGIADSSKYEPIFKLFRTQEFASPYMEKYVMEALMKTGHGDYAIERFKKRFKPMIDDRYYTTLFEGWSKGGYGGGSTNHAWSGGMLTVIAEQVCGIRPVVAGWKEFEVAPNPILSECNIEIPSVCGLIKSSFVDTDSTFTLHLSVPAGAKAYVKLPFTGNRKISINKKTIDAGSLQPLKQGAYTIIYNK